MFLIILSFNLNEQQAYNSTLVSYNIKIDCTLKNDIARGAGTISFFRVQ